MLFFVNGAVYSSWVPRIPQVKAALDLSDGALGAALLGVGAGALAGSLAAAPLVSRRGSRGVASGAAAGLCAAVVLPGLAGSWLALLAALVVVGALDAVTDIAMNAHGVVVERGYRRSIMNGFHALWSLGAVAGAVAGSAAAAAGTSVPAHLAATGGVLAVLVLASARLLLPAAADRSGPRALRVALPGRALALLALLALSVSIAEGAPGDWSAVYLTDALEVGPGAAGAAYAAFAAMMLLGRLLGDATVTRHGHVATTRAGATLAGLGLAGGLALGTPAATVAGFGAAGLGLATVFPALFSAAGNVPGTTAGVGIASVSLVARLGFLAGPPLIGAVATVVDLSAGLWLVVGAVGLVALCASAVAPADGGAA